MGEVLGKEIPSESKFMSDFWAFRKKYYLPEDNDAYWESLINDGDLLMNEYDPELKTNPSKPSYYADIVLTCVRDLERRYKAHE